MKKEIILVAPFNIQCGIKQRFQYFIKKIFDKNFQRTFQKILW